MTKNVSKKKEYSKTKKTLIINTIGVLIILFLSDIEDSYTYLFYFFNVLFVLINIFLIVFMDKLGRRINIFVFFLAAVVAFFTSYDYYIQGSQTVYLIWILFGIIYLGLAIFKEYPKLKTR